MKRDGAPGDWHNHRWQPALELAPDERRVMPRTFPDVACASHQAGCGCAVCEPMPAELKRKLRRAHRIRS